MVVLCRLNIYSVVHFTSDILHQELQCLADTVCSSLQTLTVTTVPWSKSTGECIAQLTALTSLHLMQVGGLKGHTEFLNVLVI